MPRTVFSTVRCCSPVFLLALGSCFCDGTEVYEVGFTLADASGQPMPSTQLVLMPEAGLSPEAVHPDWPGFRFSDEEGRAAADVLAWLTSCYFPPVPRDPDALYLWVRDAEGRWTEHELPVDDRHITYRGPGLLRIDLGMVRIE
jgi:hypothetical protein